MNIAANIAARQDAEEMIAFIGEKPPRFWELLAEHCAKQLPPKPEASIVFGPHAVMNEQQAIKFEATEMPFGKHVGEEIGLVPPSYLLWLTESEFVATMRRYLKSQRFQDRLDTENGR